MIPKEEADIINPWRAGEILNKVSILVNHIGKAKENKLTIAWLW